MKRKLTLFGLTLTTRGLAAFYLVRARSDALHWSINEAGAIARSLLVSHTFASPFHDANGPTAWLGPIYPGLIAVVFLIFGIQSPGSALVAILLNVLFSAATAVVVYLIGREIANERAGLLAGSLWAISPYAAMMPMLLWDTSLCALAFSYAFLRTLRLGSTTPSWMFCGLFWGLSGLINPGLLPVLILICIYQWVRTRDWRRVLVLGLAATMVLAPWILRNYLVFHGVFPVRSNGLAEIYFANVDFSVHPLGASMEYQRLGEAAYIAKVQSLTVHYFKEHPGDFVSQSARRAVAFWTNPTGFLPLVLLIEVTALIGLGLLFRRSKDSAWLFTLVLVAYPLVYYASLAYSRYRHPIEPLMYSLSGYALSYLHGGNQASLE